MSKFEGEVFEADDNLPDPAEELRQKTVEALYAEANAIVPQAARSVSSDAKGAKTPAKKGAQVRVKRTESQMIASLGGSALKEATYVAERIAKLEDKISELMGAVGQKAREHILNDYPHLSRY